MKNYFILPAIILLFAACGSGQNEFDASGTFEANEIIISAEATGVIRELQIEEGQKLTADQYVGYIDTTQLYLRMKQLVTQIRGTLSQRPQINVQVAALRVQLQSAEREQKRIASLVKADAATKKQLDDATSQVESVKKQIAAQESALGITSGSITLQAEPLQVQIEQVKDQILKSRIINPITGVVLTRYAEENEMAVTGKALYKIANLDMLKLRAYITGEQLTQIKLGQKVKVMVDNSDGGYKEYKGKISWISDKAEFTPKTIQTKSERANLVYAIKVDVPNDGNLKIGMYGEVNFK